MLHLKAQVHAHGFAAFLACAAPTLPRAVGGLGGGAVWLGFAKARGMGQQPEGGEVSVELFSEDGFEVHLNIGRPGQAGVVAQDAQLEPVAGDGPEGLVGRVECLLRQHVGAA